MGVTGVRGAAADDDVSRPSRTAAELGERSELRSGRCSGAGAGAGEGRGEGRPSLETIRRTPGWREQLVA